MAAKLGKENRKVLDKAVKYLELTRGAWVDTADIATHCKVKPAVIRSVMEYYGRENEIDRLKASARNVQWRLPPLARPEPKKEEPHEDDDLIVHLANVLGQKENYRQALLRIGKIVYGELGDIDWSKV